MKSRKRSRKVQTSLRLPRALYERAKALVRDSATDADTLNDLLIGALSTYLKWIERKQIDAAFAGMATDVHAQKEAVKIAEEFAASDWESFQMAERELHDASR